MARFLEISQSTMTSAALTASALLRPTTSISRLPTIPILGMKRRCPGETSHRPVLHSVTIFSTPPVSALSVLCTRLSLRRRRSVPLIGIRMGKSTAKKPKMTSRSASMGSSSHAGRYGPLRRCRSRFCRRCDPRGSPRRTFTRGLPGASNSWRRRVLSAPLDITKDGEMRELKVTPPDRSWAQ